MVLFCGRNIIRLITVECRDELLRNLPQQLSLKALFVINMQNLLEQISWLESRLTWRKQFVTEYEKHAKYWYRHKKQLDEEIHLLEDLLIKANGELRRTIQKEN